MFRATQTEHILYISRFKMHQNVMKSSGFSIARTINFLVKFWWSTLSRLGFGCLGGSKGYKVEGISRCTISILGFGCLGGSKGYKVEGISRCTISILGFGCSGGSKGYKEEGISRCTISILGFGCLGGSKVHKVFIFINIWFAIKRLNKYILYDKGFLKARRPPKV